MEPPVRSSRGSSNSLRQRSSALEVAGCDLPSRVAARETCALSIARLLDREGELEPFSRFHFAGDWDADGTTMTRAIADAVGRPDVKGKKMPWPLLGLAGLFQQTPRELYKMRYLWKTTIRLDNTRLKAFAHGAARGRPAGRSPR